MRDLSRTQRLAQRLVSANRFAAMEAESREWQIAGSCGHVTDVWEAGGIRYMARGRRHVMRRCPRCGTTHRFMVHRMR